MGYRSNGKKGFAVGALLGGLLGGVTALLLAPKSGVKLRKDIAKKYQCISDKTCEYADEVCEQTLELVDKAKELASSAKKAACKLYKKD